VENVLCKQPPQQIANLLCAKDNSAFYPSGTQKSGRLPNVRYKVYD